MNLEKDRNVNIKERIYKYYTNIGYDKNYLDIYVVRRSIFRFIQQNINAFHGNVLDLGCGIMPYKEFILQNSTCDNYIGVDFEKSLNNEYSLVEPDKFWDGKKIPMSDASVDVILCTELLEHCANSEDILTEANRVLKPGGKALITVPFLWNLHLVPNDEYRYTPFALKRILVASGFESIQLSALGSWDASLAQMLGIWYQQRPLRFRYALYPFIKMMISFLLRKDAFYDKSDVYKEGLMLTGICGIAYKKEQY